MSKKDCIRRSVEAITKNYAEEELFCTKEGKIMPDRRSMIEFLKGLKSIIFPGYFGNDSMLGVNMEHYAGYRLNRLYDLLREQLEISLCYFCSSTDCEEQSRRRAEEICETFFEELPEIQRLLLTDVQAAFDGDPAAKSKEDIIFSYPGLFAIYVYRVAHVLYLEKVPFVPRIMTEYAHSRTGIDINPGATIGEYFFIDHGTGVVIGETTVIGDHVKIYQGVTLGALSTRKGQLLRNVKRHPTLKDNVTVYANSTILGGETVIGERAVIAGNTFITKAVDAESKVCAKSPGLIVRRAENKRADGFE